jgi:hypothetical protein
MRLHPTQCPQNGWMGRIGRTLNSVVGSAQRCRPIRRCSERRCLIRFPIVENGYSSSTSQPPSASELKGASDSNPIVADIGSNRPASNNPNVEMRCRPIIGADVPSRWCLAPDEYRTFHRFSLSIRNPLPHFRTHIHSLTTANLLVTR